MTNAPTESSSGNLGSYLTGFVLSVFFTILAFSLVLENLLTGNILVLVLIALALAQAWVQLVFFLHLGRKSPWNLVIFVSTASIILILVVGSLWIMNHLNYNMTPQDMNAYIIKSEGIQK